MMNRGLEKRDRPLGHSSVVPTHTVASGIAVVSDGKVTLVPDAVTSGHIRPTSEATPPEPPQMPPRKP